MCALHEPKCFGVQPCYKSTLDETWECLDVASISDPFVIEPTVSCPSHHINSCTAGIQTRESDFGELQWQRQKGLLRSFALVGGPGVYDTWLGSPVLRSIGRIITRTSRAETELQNSGFSDSRFRGYTEAEGGRAAAEADFRRHQATLQQFEHNSGIHTGRASQYASNNTLGIANPSFCIHSL